MWWQITAWHHPVFTVSSYDTHGCHKSQWTHVNIEQTKSLRRKRMKTRLASMVWVGKPSTQGSEMGVAPIYLSWWDVWRPSLDFILMSLHETNWPDIYRLLYLFQSKWSAQLDRDVRVSVRDVDIYLRAGSIHRSHRLGATVRLHRLPKLHRLYIYSTYHSSKCCL